MDVTIKVSEIMSKDLVSVSPNDLMTKISKIFDNADFHHIPVVDEGQRLAGMISKHDFNLLCDKTTLFNKRSKEINDEIFKAMVAQDIMVKNLVKLHPDDPLSKAVGILKENIFHALPVIDDEKKLVGLLTTYDLLIYAYSF